MAPLRFHPAAKFERAGAMALEAKSSHIGQVALATAFGYGNDVVRIPQTFSAAQIPSGSGATASASAESTEVDVSRGTIDAAKSTYAVVSLEDFFAQVSRICA